MAESHEGKDTEAIFHQPTLDGTSFEQRKHFWEQAKLAADFTMKMIQKLELDPHTVVILDLACGGVYTNPNNNHISHYRPFYLYEMSKRGLSPQQLIGIDAGEPDPAAQNLYTHIQADLVRAINSPGGFKQLISSHLSPDQLKSLSFVTSNNFFINIAPGILDPDLLHEKLLQSLEEFGNERPNLPLVSTAFDGHHPEQMSEGAIYRLIDGKMQIDEELDDAYRVKYLSKFDTDF